MAEKMFEFYECSDPKEGSAVYRKGERILRTTLASDDVKKHNNLGRILCDLLNAWNESGKNITRASTKVRAPVDVDIKRVQEIVDAAIQNKDKLNGFQTSFIESMVDKLLQYGDNTFVSAKQMAVLDEIAEAVGV